MQREQRLAGGFRIRIRLHSKRIRAAVIPAAVLTHAVHQKLLPDLNSLRNATRHLVATRFFECQDADRAGRDPGSRAGEKGPALMSSDDAAALAQQLVPQ